MADRRAVFLDRDDTVIYNIPYLANTDQVELCPGAGDALGRLKACGFLLVLVTNQSGVGRGYIEIPMVYAQYDRLQALLASYHGTLDLLKFCPHTPEARCACRKPHPLLILEAAKALGINCSESYMIGDKPSDVQAGNAAGCRCIYLGTEPQQDACFTAGSIAEAADYIISLANT